MRFRTALTGEFGSWEEFLAAGFQVTCIPKAAFWTLKLPPRVLGPIRPAGGWLCSDRNVEPRRPHPKDSQRDLCLIFLMGPAIAPAGELAAAISERAQDDADEAADGPVNTGHGARTCRTTRLPGQVASRTPEILVKPPGRGNRNIVRWP
jgi:hypothetical protein